VVTRGAEIGFVGWLSNFAQDGPATTTCLEVDGRIDASAVGQYGVSRPDVAAALKQAGLLGSGYALRYSTANISPGVHRFVVVAVDRSSYRALPKVAIVDVRR
jgi:hypothetical protein